MASRLLRGVGSILLQTALILGITLALLEGLVALSFRFPAWSPIPATVLRQMHVLFDRHTIQVMPECAIYDPTLTYTLRPGRCIFANREFSNEFAINSLGVRDDEASLTAPRIVVLGDSIAMGWGVDQDAAFPSVIERLTGQRTLNAGVSSYGTVRELRMLERIDRSALTDVVIQYSGNDLTENEQLVKGQFKNLTQGEYEERVRSQADLLRYHPGKHTLNLLVMLRNLARERGAAAPPPSRETEARVFLDVIARSPVDLSPYAITVVALEADFIAAVRPLAESSTAPVARRIRFVDASTIASIPGAFYVLDDHPTAIGHEAIGQALVAALGQSSVTP
jgi:lysophospholipase L1-like esterase